MLEEKVEDVFEALLGMIKAAHIAGQDTVEISETEYRIVVKREIERIVGDENDNEVKDNSILVVQIDILQASQTDLNNGIYYKILFRRLDG